MAAAEASVVVGGVSLRLEPADGASFATAAEGGLGLLQGACGSARGELLIGGLCGLNQADLETLVEFLCKQSVSRGCDALGLSPDGPLPRSWRCVCGAALLAEGSTESALRLLLQPVGSCFSSDGAQAEGEFGADGACPVLAVRLVLAAEEPSLDVLRGVSALLWVRISTHGCVSSRAALHVLFDALARRGDVSLLTQCVPLDMPASDIAGYFEVCGLALCREAVVECVGSQS
jgi:hypothetical protein